MECANCGNLGKIKYRYPHDTDDASDTIFCDECFDLFVKLNRNVIS